MKLLYLFTLMSVLSCSKRNLTYFSDVASTIDCTDSVENLPEIKIRPNDLLGISVKSLSFEGNALFNIDTDGMSNQQEGCAGCGAGYLVDNEGYIQFPVLGRIKVGGMSKRSMHDLLVSELQQYLKEPTVTIRFLNFRVTVLGEVNRPSTFTISSERVSVLDALGMAGDLTVFGKRENVLVIREADGKRTLARLNLNSSDALNSPYFYLQQNDVVYVEPGEARAAQASLSRSNLSIILSAASILAILLTRIL